MILQDIYLLIEIFAFVSTAILLLQCFNYKTEILCNYVYLLYPLNNGQYQTHS